MADTSEGTAREKEKMVRNPVTQTNWTRKLTPGKNKFEAICIHWWGAKESEPGFEDILTRLAYSNAPVSAHFVAETDRIAQLAKPQQITWHAAQRKPAYVDMNPQWVSIECNPQCDDDDVLQTARLIAYLWSLKGNPVPLVKHKDKIVTSCPGPEWSWWVDSGELYKLAQQVYDGKEISMGTAGNVWNFNIKGRGGTALHAQDFLSGMADDIVSNVKNWVWDGEVENFLGESHKIRYVIRSMDAHICAHTQALAEIKATQQVILDALVKLGGIDKEKVGTMVAESLEQVLSEAESFAEKAQEVGTAV